MSAASKEEIRLWIKQGKAMKATHVIIVCDTYDYDDYPVFVQEGQTPEKVAQAYSKDMQRVMEVYSLTGKHDIESQLNERRAHHYD